MSKKIKNILLAGIVSASATIATAGSSSLSVSTWDEFGNPLGSNVYVSDVITVNAGYSSSGYVSVYTSGSTAYASSWIYGPNTIDVFAYGPDWQQDSFSYGSSGSYTLLVEAGVTNQYDYAEAYASLNW